MKLASFLALMLLAGCSTTSANITNDQPASNPDVTKAPTETVKAAESKPKGLDAEGKLRLKQDYNFGEMLVHLGDVVVIPKGIWMGIYLENNSSQNAELDVSGAYVLINGEKIEIDVTKGNTAILSSALSSSDSAKGTLAFPVQEGQNLQPDMIKNIEVYLGKFYDNELNEMADVKMNIPIQ